MSIKLKVLGLGLFAMMATSAFAVVNAGATTSGHFTTASSPTFVTGFHQDEPAAHELHFVSENGERIACEKRTYFGKHEGTKTTESLTITPSWDQCYTTPKTDRWPVHENGCDLEFTSRAEPEKNDATVYIKCPTGKAIEITHPNCNITVATQEIGGEPGNGVTYTNENDGNAWITMNVDVTFAVQYHGGICIFLGTNHHARMVGDVTVTGYSNSTHTTRTGISAT